MTDEQVFLICAGGREFRVSRHVIDLYYKEYGVTEREYPLVECLRHLTEELAGAHEETIPPSLQAKKPRQKLRSKNLIFTVLGDIIISIRISQRRSPAQPKNPRKKGWERMKLRA